MKRFLLALAALAASPALAGSDILSQDLAIDLVANPAALEVKATVVLKVDAPTSAVHFILPSGTVSAVTVDGAPAAFTTHASQYLLAVTLPTPLAANAQASIAVTFGLTPACLAAGRIECARGPAFTFLGSISQAVRWYLIAYDATDPFTGRIALKIPAGHHAAIVQGGLPTTVTNADATETWTFAYTVPTDALGFTASDAPFVTSANGRFIGTYRTPSTKPVMETVLADAQKYYPAMEAMYGPLPGDRFHFTFVPVNFFAGAVGQLNLVFLNEFMTTAAYSYIVPQVPHEMAHSWWGNLAQGETPFLSESMAEYSLWRAKSEVDGAEAGMKGRRMNAVWYQYARGSNQDVGLIAPNVTQSPVYVPVVYHKGPLVIRTLEELVGTPGLTAGLKAAIAVQPTLSIDAYLAAIASSTGADLTRFRQRWLEGTGFPKISVTPSLVAQGAGFALTLDFAMTGDFPLRLPIAVRFADGTEQTASALFDTATPRVTLTLPARPVEVQIDREWTSVRALSPAKKGDVTFDGQVDGADLLAVAVHLGGALPAERRVDGAYDPLFDLDDDRKIQAIDVDAVLFEANQ